MKAAILTELRKPLIVADLDLPSLDVGQVLVKVKYAAICGAQLNEIDGAKGQDKYLPHLLGHEGVGIVQQLGPGVTTKSVGDKVVLHWRPSEGIAAAGALYEWNEPNEWGVAYCQGGPMACFADQCIVSENRLTLLPDGIDQRVAPLFGCALTTAYGVVTRDAKLQPGESVLIFGAGGVGLAIVMMARLVNAYPIHVEDPVWEKVQAAWQRGAQKLLKSQYDVVIDTTGRSEVIQEAYSLTKPQGRTILVGVPRHDDPITIHSLPLHFGKILSGSHGGDSKPHEDIPRLAKLVRAGLLNLDGLITHEFPLEQVNDAIALVRSGEAGRVLLRMS